MISLCPVFSGFKDEIAHQTQWGISGLFNIWYITVNVLLWFVGQSIANQCHSPLSDLPVVKLTNPMQLVIQFTARFCGCSDYVSFPPSIFFSPFFSLWGFLFICFGPDCSFLLPMSCCVYVCVNVYFSVYTPTSFCVQVCACVDSDCSCLTVGRVD